MNNDNNNNFNQNTFGSTLQDEFAALDQAVNNVFSGGGFPFFSLLGGPSMGGSGGMRTFSSSSLLGGGGSGFSSSSRGAWLPASDLTESATHYTLRTDVPGIPKEELDVSVTERSKLCIKGVRKALQAASGSSQAVLMRERGLGPFERCFTFPQHIRENSVSAKFNNGELEVTMEKETPSSGGGGTSILIN